MSTNDTTLWEQNPTGLIPKGQVCPTCGRFNARDITLCAVIVKDGTVLLIKRNHEPAKGAWGFPGGYLNWDETVNEGVAREVMEETGLQVTESHLIGVRSDTSGGEDRQNVNLYFFVPDVTGVPENKDGEVSEIVWFPLNELPSPIAFAHDDLLKKFIPIITAQPTAPVPLVL